MIKTISQIENFRFTQGKFWCNLKSRNHLLFPLTLLIILFIFSLYGIHGSSIGIYNIIFYGNDYIDQDLLIGVPRPIRSDEWLVSTPWTLSQAKNNFAIVNDLFIAKQNFGTTDVPIRHWTTIFRPQNWGFFIFPIENAFAFKWWFPSIFMICSFYYLLLFFTHKINLSILGSLALFFSPFIQWWFSTSIIIIIAFGTTIFYLFIILINSNKVLSQFILTLILTYCLVGFILVLYPPFQIPIAWFYVFVAVGYTLNNIKNLNKKSFITLFLSFVNSVVICLLFYLNFDETILSVVESSYPGNRLTAGGDLLLDHLLGGFYNIQLLNERISIPNIFGNQSEASSFFFLYLFLLPFTIYYETKKYLNIKKIDWISIAILIYSLLMLGWGLGYIPTFFGKIFLLDRVPGRRLLSGLGLANHFSIIYFSYIYFSSNQNHGSEKYISLLLSLSVAAIVFIEGYKLKNNYPLFIGNINKIILISLIFGMTYLFITINKTRTGLTLFILISLATTITVNPVYRGLNPILSSKIPQQINDDVNNNPERGWIIYDNIIFGNYFSSLGAVSLSGTYATPQVDFWKYFDPEGKYNQIYNRYAHVIVSDNNSNNIEFILAQQDSFELQINPCNPILKNININYHVFNSKVNYECITLYDIIEFPNISFYIYEAN